VNSGTGLAEIAGVSATLREEAVMSEQTCRKTGHSSKEAHNRKPKRTSGRSAVIALSLMLVCLSLFSSVFQCAVGASEQYMLQTGSESPQLVAQRSKILSALENRIDNPKLMEAARSKILLMDERQTRLLSELSNRMVTDSTSTVSSIALLLITALITLL
jgi:hypothetical protein